MKTLLEHHYELRVKALSDDPRIDFAKLLKTTESLAKEKGWKFQCERDLILIRAQAIYTA